MKDASEIENLLKTTKYVCKRCKVTPTSKTGQMCPCPRGGCEAYEIVIVRKMFSQKQVFKLLKEAYLSGANAGKDFDFDESYFWEWLKEKTK